MTENNIITYNKPSVVNMYDRLRNAIQLLRISGDNISQEEINTIIIPIIVEDLKKLFLYEPINANTSFRLFDALVHIQDILIEQFKCKFLFFTSEDSQIRYAMRNKNNLYSKLKYKYNYFTHDSLNENSHLAISNAVISNALYNGYTLFFVGKKHTHNEFSPIWYIISLKFS